MELYLLPGENAMSGLWLPILVVVGIMLVACAGSDDSDDTSVVSDRRVLDAVRRGAAEIAEQASEDQGDTAVTPTADVDDTAEQARTDPDSERAADGNWSTVATDAAPPSVVPDRPGGASGFTHFVFEQIGTKVVTTLVEGPRGEQVREAISFPQLQELAQSEVILPPKLQMTRAELNTLVDELTAVREAVLRYEDVSVAFADGYIQSTDVVPNMGAHFAHRERIVDGVLNFAEPEILIYVQNEAEDWELVGTSFVLPYQLVGEDHPDGFTGPLDNWHMHYSLCTGNTINSRAASAVDCVLGGGTFTPIYGWMIHAWVVDDNPMGVFSMWNPNVPPTLTAAEIRNARDRSSVSSHLHLDGFLHAHVPSAEIPAGSVVVNIENFHHTTLEIEEGQTVIWINVDGVPHTITAGRSGASSGGFDSLLIGSGQTYRYRFDAVGEFEFTCTLHPQMNGTIIVVPRPT